MLGLGVAAPIGPVNIEIARRSVRGGFPAGLAVGCGAVTIDMLYVTAASFGTGLLDQYPRVVVGLTILGSMFLAYLGVSSLLAARRAMATDLPAAVDMPRRNYLTGLIITASSPMNLAFWIGAIPAAASALGDGGLPPIVAGVAAGALGWVVFFARLMSLAGRASQRKVMLAADLLGGTMLLIFGVWGIWRIVAIHL